MIIDILTLFPEMFEGPFSTSMLKRAQEDGLVKISIHNLRNWAEDNHKTVDDKPYGGGPGMIIKVDVVDKALKDLKKSTNNKKQKTILLSAKGNPYNQQKASELSTLNHLILIAGHYEGVDHRVHEYLVDDVISIGSYVLTGGEIPAMTVVDTVTRLLPGVLGSKESLDEESHSKEGHIEYPQYTRPENYNGLKVPKILLSGNHAEIESWRRKKIKKS